MRVFAQKNITNYSTTLLLLLFILTAVRVLGVVLTPLNLYADEAQYWRWGTSLEWGYYSKPPMIAWVINLSTSVFGTSEWAIRLPSAFLHTGAAWILFLLGRDMYSERVGFFAALLYVLMPAVSLSSGLISTDGILMPFWSLGLYCLWRLRIAKNDFLTILGLGIAIGCGVLSKYAMIYFVIGISLAIIFDPATRDALFSKRGFLAIGIAALIVTPHVAWSMAHDFKTVSHTVDNAKLSGDLINPENALTFLVDQIGVFGPISFLTLLFGVLFYGSMTTENFRRDRWLLYFILPVLIIILIQSVLSRANANWAATAYPAASILVSAWLVNASANRRLWIIISLIVAVAFLFIPDFTTLTRLGSGLLLAALILGVGKLSTFKPEGLIWSSLVLKGAIAALLFVVAVLPTKQSSGLGFDNALKRAKGWDSATAQIMAQAEALNATAILVDEREVWHGLDYYSRERSIPLLSWRRYGVPKSFAETQPVSSDNDQRVLVASIRSHSRPKMRADFDTFEHVGAIEIPLGHKSNGCAIVRRFELYIASGHAPLERSAEWEEAFRDKRELTFTSCKP